MSNQKKLQDLKEAQNLIERLEILSDIYPLEIPTVSDLEAVELSSAIAHLESQSGGRKALNQWN